MPSTKSVRAALRIVASLLLLAAGNGCTYRPSVYAPNALLLPTFDSAGQAALGGTFGTASYSARIAWSPLQHLYVHGGLSGFGDQLDSTSEHAWHSFVEAGVGGYFVADAQIQLDAALAYGRGRAIGNGRDNCWFCYFPSPGGYELRIRQLGSYSRASAQMSLATAITRSSERRVRLQSINAVRFSRVMFDELLDEATAHDADTITTSISGRTDVARNFLEVSFGGRLRVHPVSLDLLILFSKGLDPPSFDVVSVQLLAGMSLHIDELLEYF